MRLNRLTLQTLAVWHGRNAHGCLKDFTHIDITQKYSFGMKGLTP